jgi:exo-1,4-beta-D-glucosaminidase
MLNNAWPSLIWHLYDYYLTPAGGYFGTKKACEMLHVQYSYDDNSVAVINGYDRSVDGLKVTAKIYDIDSQEKASRESTLDAASDSSMRAFELPAVDGISSTYFLKLQLRDRARKLVSDNFYWLSTKPDVLDWAKKEDTVYTPQSAYGDLTGLSTLASAQVAVETKFSHEGAEGIVRATVRNTSSHLAFMLHLRLTDSGEDVVPIFWDDNYFSLLPGERREVAAHFDSSKLKRGQIALAVDGWNVAPFSDAVVSQLPKQP